MTELFGTDGIRGKANHYPITPEMAVKIGKATASRFKKKGKKQQQILIAKDTRISGDMLEAGLAAGICSMGMDAALCGVLPTPGVAWITSAEKAAAGISISASHNPFYDNGIKIFNSDGVKLSDEEENEIEEYVLRGEGSVVAPIDKTGHVLQMSDTQNRYADFLSGTLPADCSFKGFKIVIDCANGAVCKIAPELFRRLGADVTSLFDSPDGVNINANCGSEHPEFLKKYVISNEVDIGVAFDGDGDRLIAVDEKGNSLEGDQLLAIFSNAMIQERNLKNNVLVSTVMSNIGLGLTLKKLGVRHIMADVGDRRVKEKMKAVGAVLGGENSGHIIFSEHHTTGDGMLSALQLISIMRTASKPLSELARIMKVYPQALINVEVKSKPPLKKIPAVQTAIQTVEKKLAGNGRVLVRYSGTQPLCRVMVEGPSHSETKALCNQIAESIKDILG